MKLYRMGECKNCGDCCTLYINGQYKKCIHYDTDKERHCTIYKNRPQECRDFPRSPMELVNKPSCGYWFVDEAGNCVDGWMDKRVRLRLVR